MLSLVFFCAQSSSRLLQIWLCLNVLGLVNLGLCLYLLCPCFALTSWTPFYEQHLLLRLFLRAIALALNATLLKSNSHYHIWTSQGRWAKVSSYGLTFFQADRSCTLASGRGAVGLVRRNLSPIAGIVCLDERHDVDQERWVQERTSWSPRNTNLSMWVWVWQSLADLLRSFKKSEVLKGRWDRKHPVYSPIPRSKPQKGG